MAEAASIQCQQCGRAFPVTPWQIRTGRRFCSQRCVFAHRVGNTYAFRGDNVTRWAYHKRAGKLKGPGPCERCDGPGQVVHHRDHDPSNNVPANLERLCRACHARHHHSKRKELQP